MRLTVFDIVDKGVPTGFSFLFPLHTAPSCDFSLPKYQNENNSKKNSKSVLSSFTYSLVVGPTQYFGCDSLTLSLCVCK